MSGDLRVQVGARSTTYRSPHRVVFGRRHTTTAARPIGESYESLSEEDGSMSREWFSVEDALLSPAVPGSDEGEERALLIRCLSQHNSVQVWDGGDPVRVRSGGRYLAQGETVFAGDLVGGRIVGARVEQVGSLARTALIPSAGRSAGVTAPPPNLEVAPLTRNVLMARYHRYYRTPPAFDPQPVPWADVAVQLRLLTLSEAADPATLRRAVKPAQDAVTGVKQRVDVMYPGWLPAGSETQKTFHDHLRTVLEMHGFFTPDRLASFDSVYSGRPRS